MSTMMILQSHVDLIHAQMEIWAKILHRGYCRKCSSFTRMKNGKEEALYLGEKIWYPHKCGEE